MRYPRNSSIFAFGQADKARASATVHEILDAMWLFDAKLERALSKFDEIKARQESLSKSTRWLYYSLTAMESIVTA